MKRIALAILLATAPLTSLATGSWVVGINYMNLSEDVDAFDVSLGGLAGSVGHKVNIVDNFYLIPEVRFGTGISDDTVRYLGVSVDLELDRFIALSVRGQYEFDNNLYLFAAPAYANAKFTASASQGNQSASFTDDSWEFGIGIGAGLYLTDTVAIEAMFEGFDGTDVISAGLRFNF